MTLPSLDGEVRQGVQHRTWVAYGQSKNTVTQYINDIFLTMASVYEPDKNKWKTEIFPKILHDFILKRIKNLHLNDSTDILCHKERIMAAAKKGIWYEVCNYFKENGLIEPDYRYEYNHPTGIFSSVEADDDEDDECFYDISKEYYDLNALCPDFSSEFDKIMAEYLAGATPGSKKQ